MSEVITNNLDLWSSALLTKSAAGRGSNGRQEAYGIKKLRELILELAVRGKLVPQDPNDEPASELLKRIQTERAELIAAGKIKKDKPQPPISDEDKPFDLSTGWEWVRLGDIAETIRGVTYGKSDASDSPLPDYVPLLRGNNINRFLNFDSLVFVPKKLLNEEQYVKAGDIVIAMSSGSADLVGKAAQATEDFSGGFGAFCGVIRSVSAEALIFFGFFFQTPLYRNRAAGHGKGIGINNLQKTVLQTLEIPLPPLAEQRRIVAKVDELMALCDQLEQQQTNSIEAHQTLVETLLSTLTRVASQQELAEAWTRIANHFDTLFTTKHSIDQLKQTILQLAVMGKLVRQDTNDEPASALLKKVAKEKESLIKERKIKKQDPLPEVGEAEKPHVLPQSWEWARFGDLAFQITDGAHHTPTYVPEGIPFLSVKDMSTGKLNFSDTRYISRLQHEDLSKRCCPKKGDLLLTKVGTTGIPVLIDTDDEFSIFVSVALIKFPQDKILGNYLSLLVNSPLVKAQSKEGTEGIGNKNLVLRKIAAFVLAIPPLYEQQRIVAKVDELMALCDALKTRLKEAQSTQIHLADAIVEQAVA